MSANFPLISLQICDGLVLLWSLAVGIHLSSKLVVNIMMNVDLIVIIEFFMVATLCLVACVEEAFML